MRLNRNIAGWLAIPASLFLWTGCATTEPAGEPVAANSQVVSESNELPFVQIFGEEADIHVITFFDLYCVACQQSASNMVKIPEALGNISGNSRVSITGIGFGDTAFEVEVFLKRYPLPYTCHPDPEKTYAGPFSIRGTPTVLCFVRIGDECREVYRHEGRFRSDDLAKLQETVVTNLPSNP